MSLSARCCSLCASPGRAGLGLGAWHARLPPSPGVQRLYWQDRTPKAERLEYVCSTNKQNTEMTCTSFNEKGNVDVHAMVVQSARSIYNTVQINNRGKNERGQAYQGIAQGPKWPATCRIRDSSRSRHLVPAPAHSSVALDQVTETPPDSNPGARPDEEVPPHGLESSECMLHVPPPPPTYAAAPSCHAAPHCVRAEQTNRQRIHQPLASLGQWGTGFLLICGSVSSLPFQIPRVRQRVGSLPQPAKVATTG